MKKAAFILNILMLFCTIVVIVYGFIKIDVIFVSFGILFFIVSIVLLKDSYEVFVKDFYTKNRNLNWRYKQLTKEEVEIIEDAKKLIKRVDENIVISDFNVYKIKFISNGWCYYDESTQQISIFIPFKKFLKYGKDFCFLTVLHEVLHSQNLKENLIIFDNGFLEGVNQLLTVWLIENYSQKYKVPETIYITSIRLSKSFCINISRNYTVYDNEVKIVQDLLKEADIDLKQVFLKYIDIQPEFFKSFVPSKYFVKK